MKQIICILALLLIASTSSAVLIDLDKYILSTGNNYVDVNLALPSTNESSGEYSALVSYDEGLERVDIFLHEGENATNLNETNLTKLGYKRVNKPYPGWMLTNSTTDQVYYQGVVHEGFLLTAVFASYQVAIDRLPDLAIISKEEYQTIKAEELEKALA